MSDRGSTASPDKGRVVIVGAGPAGLTAARELTRAGFVPTVFEADDQVGGISRTVERDGWRFDIGGHRFFTKVERVRAFWREVLGPEDFPTRRRLSRIYYQGKFFAYPIKPFDALGKLGPIEAFRCLASYVATRIAPPKDQSDFESWVAARFGWRLYRIFFKTYTEKVWGVPATAIRSDWAAQRIKGLSLPGAVWNAFRTTVTATKHVTLIDRFEYPRLGPGMIWERTAELVTQAGGDVRLKTKVVTSFRNEDRVIAVEVESDDGRQVVAADHVISSMPLGELVLSMSPPPPDHVIDAAKGLSHRDFLTVALIVPEDDSFPDNWIYVHDPAVKLGRVQNFRAWSPDMVKDGLNCLGLEYFVFEGDELWGMPDEELIAFATEEITRIGLVAPGLVQHGYVVRMPRAYPVYDAGYADRVQIIRDWLEREVPNVHPVGRNGMHRYNNQDHSMLTAMLAVENVQGAKHEVWEVNLDAEYHEEGGHRPTTPTTSGSWGGLAGTGRDAPAMIEGGAARSTTSTTQRDTRGWLADLSRRSPVSRRVLRFGFRSMLDLRRVAKATARRLSLRRLGDRQALRQLTWVVYRAAFHFSTIGWLRRMQFRIRDRFTFRRTLVPVEKLLVGGWNGLSAQRFAESSGYLLDPSTRLLDSAQVTLLRQADELGDGIYESDALRESPYVARVREAARISGHHRGASTEEQFLDLAREFVDRYRGRAIPYRPGRTIDSVLPRVRRIDHSDCYEVRDGHHRLAIAAAQGKSEVEVAVERPRSQTPAQRLLQRMSWLDGQGRLYQPVPLPEVATWPLMRRCEDRLQLMTDFLSDDGLNLDTSPTTYLDIGACYGWFVSKMRDRGYDAYGIESDPLAKEAAQLFYGLDPARIITGDAVTLLDSQSIPRHDIVSCFSVLHHFVLGRGPCSAERLMSLLDAASGAVLFIDMGQAHESWFKYVLPEWDTQFIQKWIVDHSSFTDVRALGTDHDDVPPFEGKFGRTLFACTR